MNKSFSILGLTVLSLVTTLSITSPAAAIGGVNGVELNGIQIPPLAGVALAETAKQSNDSKASAKQPMQLSEKQMDGVTAGNVVVTLPYWIAHSPYVQVPCFDCDKDLNPVGPFPVLVPNGVELNGIQLNGVATSGVQIYDATPNGASVSLPRCIPDLKEHAILKCSPYETRISRR